jgi:hypothetical protein
MKQHCVLFSCSVLPYSHNSFQYRESGLYSTTDYDLFTRQFPDFAQAAVHDNKPSLSGSYQAATDYVAAW